MSMLSTRRLLILEHTGFIGSHLKQHFHVNFPNLEVLGEALPRLDLAQSDEASRLPRLLDMDTVVIACSAIKRQLGGTIYTLIRMRDN